MGSPDRAALAEFLRRRRADLQPDDVGLPVPPRRRSAGLRREDVAHLAAMSTDYYTRLEQRRGPQPSPPILAALARALRLTAAERDYLFQVSGHPSPDPGGASPHVPPALLRVFDRLQDTPALIISDLGETLVQNAMAVALLGDDREWTGPDRWEVYRWFTRTAVRRRYPPPDQERHSRALVAALRASYGRSGPTSPAAEIAAELTGRSQEFARLWERQEVARRFEDHKTIVHPEIGPIGLDCQVLFTEDRNQALLTLTAPPGSAADQRLALLRVVGTERFTPAPAD